MGGDKPTRPEESHGVRVRSSVESDSPAFQSRLRAKREERMLQRQLEQELRSGSTGLEINMKHLARADPESSPTANDAGASSRINSHRYMLDSGEDALKRRERAEARKRVIENQGSVWDAITNNDLRMVQSYFLVEGAQTLLRRRHPDAEEGGRSLLHCAAWHGFKSIVEFILSTGFDVDAIDSVAGRTTALLEAARAGHADVCVCLLQRGANPRHRDSYGDTAFHWAGRQGHGSVLLQMALEQEHLEPGSTPTLWVMKNHKGRTAIELVQGKAFVVPLLQKRLGASFTRALESAKGKRRSRFPARAAGLARKVSVMRVNSRPGQDTTEMASLSDPSMLEALDPTPSTLSGVQELGLDVSSFAYRSRASSTSSSVPDAQVWQLVSTLEYIQLSHLPSNTKITMDGILLTVSSDDNHRHQLQKIKKQVWQNLFLKLDDISARLIAFADRSQSEVRWSVQLVGADISTPIPGEPSHGIELDEVSYCFYIRETSAAKDCTHYFSAPDDKAKKAWMKALTQIARDGPRSPRFAVSQAENEFEFHARVVKFRPHADGNHAEYMVTCSCQVFSKLVARRLMKEWSLWRRFSEFDELHQALKNSMGPQMEGIELVKHKRDALRGVMGKAFDNEFLEARRVLLDSFVTSICGSRTAVDFFKHHADPHLKVFFQFDDNCQDVDQRPRKANGSPNRSKGSQSASRNGENGRASASSRASEPDEGRKSAHSRASDAASEGSRSRSKGSRSTTRHSETDKRRASTSSKASDRSTNSRTHYDDIEEDDGLSHHHHHRKKSDDVNEKERLDSDKRDKHSSGKRKPASNLGSVEELRLADTTA